MAVIGWGKPRIFTKRIDNEGSAWKEVPIPVEDSTTLETTKGDKTEAKLEGGSNEDVKYGANTYALSYTIRVAKGKTQPFEQNDGYVAGEYAVALQPEDPNVPGFMIEKSVVSAEDGFSTAEGGTIIYTHDALKPETGNQIKWGVISVSESDGTISDVSLTS